MSLNVKRTVEQGHIRQNFSHGRSKSVLVETKRKRVTAPGLTEEPQQQQKAEPAPAKPQPRVFQKPSPDQARDKRPQKVLRELSAGEMDARTRALIEARKREDVEKREREIEDAREREDAKLREVEDQKRRVEEEAQRKVDEEAERLRAAEAGETAKPLPPKPAAKPAAMAQPVEPQPAKPRQRKRLSPKPRPRGPRMWNRFAAWGPIALASSCRRASRNAASRQPRRAAAQADAPAARDGQRPAARDGAGGRDASRGPGRDGARPGGARPGGADGARPGFGARPGAAAGPRPAPALDASGRPERVHADGVVRARPAERGRRAQGEARRNTRQDRGPQRGSGQEDRRRAPRPSTPDAVQCAQRGAEGAQPCFAQASA